jgi:hypothetical protein
LTTPTKFLVRKFPLRNNPPLNRLILVRKFPLRNNPQKKLR